MTVVTIDALAAKLPAGYRARPFEERDREPLVAARNAEVHPMERGSADEWRRWEGLASDPTLHRVSIDAPDGTVAAMGDVSAGFFPRTDGALRISVGVMAQHRRLGVGSALLDALEAEARRRGAPRLFAGASAAQPFALDWAARRGYREIGRRISSFVDLATFDPTRFADALARVRDAGIRLRTFAEVLAERDDAGRDRFWHELYEAEAPMWEDIPWSSPSPHWPFERFYRMAVTSGQGLFDVSVIAYDGDRIAGFTSTGKNQERDGHTWMTGTAREYRGRGVAMALKVQALTLAKRKGLRAMGTTNDEPNRSMRGINAKLGYEMLPAHVELEKALS